MKHKILLSALIITAALGTRGQNGSPYWSVSGNSNAAASSNLGTTNAIPLVLTTNNIPRLYVATDGRLGFGTITPATQFHVEGTSLNIFVSPAAVSTTSGSGLVGYVKGTPTASGQRLGYFLTGAQNGGTDPGNATGMVGYADGPWGTQSRPSYLTFETTSSGSRDRAERMRIAANGFVGIGITTPAHQLDVAASGIAVYGASSSSVGVYGTSSYVAGDGVHGSGTGQLAYGGYFTSANSYGVYASTQSSSQYAAHFDGNVYASGMFQASDKKLKKNITDFTDAITLIRRLKPKTYEFQSNGKLAEMNLPGGKHYGLIAQDLETILPDLVKETIQYPRHNEGASAVGTDSAITSNSRETFKAVNYTELIPILIKGMQEQDEEIQTLKATVQELKSMLLAGNTSGSLSSVSLDVASPNPAKTNTTIRYSTPAGTASARLIVVNMSGQVLKEFSLTGGAGQVNLNVSGLAAGSYPCTLWMNGQPAISKQLLVAR